LFREVVIAVVVCGRETYSNIFYGLKQFDQKKEECPPRQKSEPRTRALYEKLVGSAKKMGSTVSIVIITATTSVVGTTSRHALQGKSFVHLFRQTLWMYPWVS